MFLGAGLLVERARRPRPRERASVVRVDALLQRVDHQPRPVHHHLPHSVIERGRSSYSGFGG